MNNVAKYEVSIFDVMTSRKLGALSLVLFSDSRLMVNEHAKTFEAKDDKIKVLEEAKK